MDEDQRTSVPALLTDPDEVVAVREQSLRTLEANHHYFEEIEAFGGPARRALATIYRDAFSVLDAVGWEDAPEATRGGAEAPDADGGPVGVEVPLTRGHVEQLWTRRFELGHANIDRVERTTGWTVEDLEPNRRQFLALDRVLSAWFARARG